MFDQLGVTVVPAGFETPLSTDGAEECVEHLSVDAGRWFGNCKSNIYVVGCGKANGVALVHYCEIAKMDLWMLRTFAICNNNIGGAWSKRSSFRALSASYDTMEDTTASMTPDELRDALIAARREIDTLKKKNAVLEDALQTERARYASLANHHPLMQERLWLQRAFRTCGAQHIFLLQ